VLNNAAPESELFKRQNDSKRGSLKISFYLESTCNPKIFPLLLQAIIRFTEATNGSGQQVLASAEDMETLVTGIVFTVPQAFPEEQRLGSIEEKLPAALWLISKVFKLFNNGYVLCPSLCWKRSRTDFLLGSWRLRRTKIQQPHWGEARGAEGKLGAKVVEGIRSSYFERCIV
jgi:hypothetical protein